MHCRRYGSKNTPYIIQNWQNGDGIVSLETVPALLSRITAMSLFAFFRVARPSIFASFLRHFLPLHSSVSRLLSLTHTYSLFFSRLVIIAVDARRFSAHDCFFFVGVAFCKVVAPRFVVPGGRSTGKCKKNRKGTVLIPAASCTARQYTSILSRVLLFMREKKICDSFLLYLIKR